MQAAASMSIAPTGAALGAEIRGVDLARDLDSETFGRIEEAFDRHGVIFFRGQTITVEQQIAFARRFGNVEINVNTQACLQGRPEVLLVSNVKENGRYIGLADAGTTWHTDMSAYACPPRCSILHAIEVPRAADGTVLGDTIFASAAAAYDALAPELKSRLEGRRSTHSYLAKMMARKAAVGLTREVTPEHLEKTPPVAHPVFRTHPVTGRKCLYVTEGECIGIDGMAEADAVPLISRLHRHLIDPRFQYRHRWRVGDVLMWDNCTCQHLAVRDYGESLRRLMHRVTVNGSVPF
ncbi:MAG: TauD/TfdA family dioxygenase [Betaproteobacteria bacterium]|nr:TauD/TfdA family dioxygenase [Betaproteobacteria bacterium]